MRTERLMGSVFIVLLATAVFAAAPKFTKKPTAKKAGDKVRIQFAVDRETDVAVYIEDAKGKIIRHLAAGVLGKNPPKPLKPDSLSQTMEWDGKDDDGKPVLSGVEGRVGGGPLKVRVALGLDVKYSGSAFAPPGETGPAGIAAGVYGLAAGPDGRLYVLGRRGGEGKNHHRGTTVQVFRRDGAYEKTIKPPPAHLPEKRLKAIGAFRNDEGGLTPLLFHPWTMSFYPYSDIPQQMAVTPQGQLLLAVVPVWPKKGTADRLWSRDMDPKPGAHLAVIDADGGIPQASYAGPALLGQTSFSRYPYLAASTDGRAAYVTGLGGKHAVYRVALPERGPAEVFFGDPKKAGGDQTHLSNPRGIACDGRGHVLIADGGNNRVVVVGEKDRRLAGSFAVAAPDWVAVHPRTGAVYVHSKDSVLKFSGWKSPREVTRLEGLKAFFSRLTPAYAKHVRLRFALDASGNPPVLWIGRNMGPKPLLRCQDRGTTFTVPTPARCYSSRTFWNLSVNPAASAKVACRVDGPGPNGAYEGRGALRILDEKSGRVRVVDMQGVKFFHAGCIRRLGLDGQIFCMNVTHSISRHDREGKFVPYEDTVGWMWGTMTPTKGLMANKHTGQSGWTRDMYVDRRGDVYVHHRLGQHPIRVDVFNGATGKFKRTAVVTASRNAFGPRVDTHGNIYLAEAIKPGEDLYPKEFAEHLRGRSNELWYSWMYGSMVKFGPQGGGVWWPTGKGGFFEEEKLAKLPGSIKKVKVTGCYGGRITREVMLQGEWRSGWFSGVSRKPLCHCVSTDFDVDDFGRTFYPDLLRFRVGVLDTSGNEILHFGSYGNQDSCGPDSYVLEPVGKYLRPRRKTDPQTLKSPLAEPEIAFAWIVGLAVTDRYVYVADDVNKRVLRCKLSYAAEETCEVK